MSALSLFLRILSISAAIVVVTFYMLGGNKLKKTQATLQDEITLNQKQQSELEAKEAQFQKTKEQLDETVLELATFKRDKRLSESAVLLVKQELEKSRQQVGKLENANMELAESYESLRRETIDLKAQGFDPANNPKILTAQIEEQRVKIRMLESELSDAETVINSLFASAESGVPIQALLEHSKVARIQRWIPEHQILVIEAGTSDGIRENMTLKLLKDGNTFAKVKVARATPDLCVVNILSSHETGEMFLQPGVEIEYIF